MGAMRSVGFRMSSDEAGQSGELKYRRKTRARGIAAVGAAVALTLASAAVVVASPGIASAVNNNPPGNPTSPAISYEADCSTGLEAGVAAPFVTSLDGDTTVDDAAPTGATFGFSGTANTTIIGAFVANLFVALGGIAASTSLSVNWEDTIASTNVPANATGSYSYDSPVITEPDGGGTVKSVTWTNDSETLTGNFSKAAVGDGVATEDAVGIPAGATITAITGKTSATISDFTTEASAAATTVGFGATTQFADPSLNTGATAFTTNGVNGDTAGVGVTSITEFVVKAGLTITFGGTPGDGGNNCLETGWTGGATPSPGPAQTCGTTPACSTAPVFPADTTTALVSASPLQFPSAAFVNLQSSESAPGAPTIGVATAGNASATVNWTAPTNDGGSPITGYVITPFIAGVAQTPVDVGDVTTDDVTGLTNGTAYTFTVAATNAIGTGAASAASNSVTPEAPTVPGAPTIGVAAPGNASATVNWTAPASDGGSAITGYVITPFIAGVAQTPVDVGDVTTDDVTGLTNGTAYTFTVAATNAIGTGAASAASNSVTPASLPSAPTIGTATAGNASATVNWTAPTSDGGSPITGYVITPFIAGVAQTPVDVGNVLTDDVTGLTNGTTYTFTVAATTAIGTGPASAASNAVTPLTVPGAPSGVSATAGNTSATVNWRAPTDDGGSAITGYVITPFIAGVAQTPVDVGDVTTDDVTGLTNGTAYTFTVAAENSVGTGPASAASNAVTPSVPTAPGAPTGVSATAGNASATVSWTAPASDGNSPILGYLITPFIGGVAQTSIEVGNVTTDNVTGLTNGTAYTFTVTAANAIGAGPASAPSNAVTPSAPVQVGGYWLVTSNGGVFPEGSVTSHGSAASIALSHPIVGAAATPDGQGYWLVASDGGVFSYGTARYHGSLGGVSLNAPIVGMVATPDGNGYWLVGADGGVFAFGDAHYEGSMGGTHLNAPVVGIAGNGTTNGYWLVGSDGGVFSFGSARYHGSTGGVQLNAPITGIAAAPGGQGYWLVGSDGGVFSFGAAFHGSASGSTSGSPVTGMAATPTGYVLSSENGGVFAFGTPFFGSQVGNGALGGPVVAITS